MPNWDQLLGEIKAAGSTHDLIRRSYLRGLYDLTGRNTIVYYSGWLEKMELLKQGLVGFGMDDSDKNGFMACIHGMDRSKGLDLVLHTPGGETAATESIVDYLRSMFEDIRVVVPHLAMSAGTMLALASGEIVMGKHSSLGPIDPQIYGMPAHGVKEEFERAAQAIRDDPSQVPLWQPIIAKYHPTLIGECEKVIEWSEALVRGWLTEGMFAGEADAEAKTERVLQGLGDPQLALSHARHISAERARELGLNVLMLEDDQDLQEAVLSLHHCCVQTIQGTAAMKIIENHEGVATVRSVQARR